MSPSSITTSTTSPALTDSDSFREKFGDAYNLLYILLNNAYENFLLIDRDLRPEIDSIILGCTHYPLLLPVIRKFVPENVHLLEQGKLVSSKLIEYLSRHPEIDQKCTKSGIIKYFTTENEEVFEKNATTFLGQKIRSEKIVLK